MHEWKSFETIFNANKGKFCNPLRSLLVGALFYSLFPFFFLCSFFRTSSQTSVSVTSALLLDWTGWLALASIDLSESKAETSFDIG